jgi:hypothetical protein
MSGSLAVAERCGNPLCPGHLVDNPNYIDDYGHGEPHCDTCGKTKEQGIARYQEIKGEQQYQLAQLFEGAEPCLLPAVDLRSSPRGRIRTKPHKRWTSEETEKLRLWLGPGGMKIEELAAWLQRSPDAIKNKAAELHISYARKATNRHGPSLYWTEERVLEGLRKFIAETRGELPTSDDVYMPLQKGRRDLPAALYVYRYFRSFPIAWRAAGAPKSRLNFTNAKWREADVEYLLEHAGTIRLEDIAVHLGRTYQAVRAKIGGKGLGITARANQGLLSASLLAKEFNTSYHRVCTLLAAGNLPGYFNERRHCWQVDLGDLTEEHKALLGAPRDTHKNTPVDRGDYYQRYGLMRTMVDGRLKVVKKERG